MGIFNTDKTKEKKEKEPAYYLSATKIPVRNYRVYYLSKTEKIHFGIIAFIAGGAVGYLFYGGIGKTEFGPQPITYICDFLSIVLVGTVATIIALPQIAKSKQDKRRRALSKQFRDMLDALTTSVGAGRNVTEAFVAAREDLGMQYDEDADILHELDVINGEVINSVPLEDLLESFGERSGIDDIKSFANVFRISYRKGGNMKDIIRNTHAVLSDKMAIKEEIETLVSGNKFEQKIMMVMPILLIALIKFAAPDFAEKFTTGSGLAATTVAIAMFVASFFLSKKMMDIKL